MFRLVILFFLFNSLNALPIGEGLVPLYEEGDIIPDSYIVKINNAVGIEFAKDLADWFGATAFWHIKNEQVGDFIGFAGVFDEETLYYLLEKTEAVEYIERDQIARTDAQQLNPPSWGLGAISSTTATNQGYYNYPDHGGAGTKIYILDTGIRCTHVEFTGRCTWGARFGQGGFDDLNGHGTHVAGTAAGTTYGVAKLADLVAVGVLNPSGTGPVSNIIAGVNFAADNCPVENCVISMSLSTSISASLDSAVNAAVSPNRFVSVSAGNTNIDASNVSPARAVDAYAVMASNAVAKKWASSNWGSVCDIFAPGTSIVSAWNTTDTATNTLSGTSMSCPHVSGAAALAFSSGHGDPLDRTAIRTYIESKATNGVLLNVPAGTVNRFIYVDANF